jgi:hypothetical protein
MPLCLVPPSMSFRYLFLFHTPRAFTSTDCGALETGAIVIGENGIAFQSVNKVADNRVAKRTVLSTYTASFMRVDASSAIFALIAARVLYWTPDRSALSKHHNCTTHAPYQLGPFSPSSGCLYAILWNSPSTISLHDFFSLF